MNQQFKQGRCTHIIGKFISLAFLLHIIGCGGPPVSSPQEVSAFESTVTAETVETSSRSTPEPTKGKIEQKPAINCESLYQTNQHITN